MKYLENNLTRRDLILKRKSDIENIFILGKTYFSKNLKMVYKKNNMIHFRFLATASKKWGKSHERNRFIRVVKEIVWKKFQKHPLGNWDVVILPRYRLQKDFKGSDIQNEIQDFLKKLLSNQ